MSKTKDSASLLRGYETTRFGLGLGRNAICAGVIVLLCLLLALLAHIGIGEALPQYLGGGSFGTCYFCAIVSTVGCGLWLIIKPGVAVQDTLKSNTLNLYYKMGAGRNHLAVVRLEVAIFGMLRIYIAAFAVCVGAGFLFGRDDFASALHILLLFSAGLCGIMMILTPTLLAGTIAMRPLVVRIVAVVMLAAVLMIMLAAGFIGMAENGEEAADALVTLMKPSITSLTLVAAVITSACAIATVAFTEKRLVEYNEQELDYGDLTALGVTGDMEIYERDGEGLTMLISGAQLADAEDATTEEIGEFKPRDSEPEPKKPSSKKVKEEPRESSFAKKKSSKKGKSAADVQKTGKAKKTGKSKKK